MRIHQLPTIIANQIAAGEVIERPASVVKELLENSLDAKASNIFIELGYAGINQIKISDDGVGIFAEDLPLAISAHATSKISKLNDLYNITSMGFRGEALASIASIARLTISSRPKLQKHAMQITVNAEEINLTPCARSFGTTIDVQDLFFNAPVRKKFLKTERSELQAIEEIVKRFALSAPQIALSLQHNGKQILKLPAALCTDSRQLRIKKILGARFIEDAIVLDVSSSKMSLRGLIARHTYQLSSRDKQLIYVNNRMVKDKLLQHAIVQAYQDIIHPGRFPACLLYLDMPASEMDINVHPTKHEIRFQDPRMVHDFLVSSIISKLASDNPTSSSILKDDSAITTQQFYNPKTYPHASKDYHSRANYLDSAPHILNDSFAVIYKNNQPYLFNLAKAYHSYSRDMISNQEFPLESRPLLVPVSYEISKAKYALLEKLAPITLKYGISFDFISESCIIIRTIPKALPLLEIKLLFDKIIDNSPQKLDLESLILASQLFDALQTTLDEQIILLNYIENHNLFAKFCVHLSNSTCLGMFKDV